MEGNIKDQSKNQENRENKWNEKLVLSKIQ